MILDLLAIVLAFLIVLNAWVTWRVIRDDLSTGTQRCAQVLLVWIVPFFGALLVLHLQRQYPERSSGRYRDALDAGGDVAGSPNSYGRVSRGLDGDAAPD